MPGRNGGTLNRGGSNPGAGRPRKTAAERAGKRMSRREFMDWLSKQDDVHDAVLRAATDPECRGFAIAQKLLSEYDADRPAPPQATVPHEVVIRVIRDGIAPQFVAPQKPLELPAGEAVVVIKRDEP